MSDPPMKSLFKVQKIIWQLGLVTSYQNIDFDLTRTAQHLKQDCCFQNCHLTQGPEYVGQIHRLDMDCWLRFIKFQSFSQLPNPKHSQIFHSSFTLLRGPEDFGKLPFWAHLLPTALAQFHTILAMIVFSNGPLYILGLCNDLTGGSHEFGVLWWPVAASRCEGWCP